MTMIQEETMKLQGYHLHLVPTKKYKTITVVVKFKGILEREQITKRVLLPYILRKGTANYPTEKLFQEKLNQLYGAVLSIDGAKKGNQHILSFRLEFANQKYIADEASILDEAIRLLHEVIFSPSLEGDAFKQKTVEREKESLKQRIASIADDKMAYANQRLIDEMCENERFSIHSSGYMEDLEDIDAENMYAYYQSVIQEKMDIYVVGDIQKEAIVHSIRTSFDRENTSIATQAITPEEHTTSEVKEVIEKQDVQQAKLHIGYRTHTTYQSEDYFALQVFNGIFGGFPSSKLFINVREKNSLAYYASSRVESHKGLLFVISGIAPADYQKAREIIELQLQMMKSGDFTENDVEETKEQLINQILETLDHTQGIVEMLYQEVIGERDLPPHALIEGIKAVTREDIIQVANKIKQDTVYLLTDKGEVND